MVDRKQGDNGRIVSIPQGTIKSAAAAGGSHVRTSFQFHKVRLKDELGRGTASVTVFQFHKVRLKEDKP